MSVVCPCHCVWLYMWIIVMCLCSVFFVKQKTAYEMRISDWSSDVCSSDLQIRTLVAHLWENDGEVLTVTGQFLDSVNVPPPGLLPELWAPEIGRASCRESVCQYV